MGKDAIIILFSAIVLTILTRGGAYLIHMQDPYLHEGKILRLHTSYPSYTDRNQLRNTIRTGEIPSGKVHIRSGQYIKIKSTGSDLEGYLKIVECDEDGNELSDERYMAKVSAQEINDNY
jgi:hypothetical protein